MHRHQKYSEKISNFKIDALKFDFETQKFLKPEKIRSGSNAVFEPLCMAGAVGQHIAAQSALLAHPNAAHLGTGLRKTSLQNMPPACFIIRSVPS